MKPARARLPLDDSAVSEVVGNVLLVAITIVFGVLVAGLILSQPPPLDTTRPNLAIELHPGPDLNWNSGEENVSVYHRGGEGLSSDQITIIIRTPANEYSLTASGLQSAFADGTLRIGETWYSTAQPFTLAQGARADIAVIAARNGGTVLIASGGLTAGG